ncbi:hypothetical protein [Streptomyces sp. NPDC051310]|uniref:hypothetical protein n=1 Tax=Streptomyces sp. NPDC051310 TaxID=3365649 RepID=UPI0037B2CEC7
MHLVDHRLVHQVRLVDRVRLVHLSGCRHAGRRRITGPRDLAGVPVARDTGRCRHPARAAGAEAALPLRAACPAVSVQGLDGHRR